MGHRAGNHYSITHSIVLISSAILDDGLNHFGYLDIGLSIGYIIIKLSSMCKYCLIPDHTLGLGCAEIR